MLDERHKPQQVQQFATQGEIGMAWFIAEAPNQDIDPFVTGKLATAIDILVQVCEAI